MRRKIFFLTIGLLFSLAQIAPYAYAGFWDNPGNGVGGGSAYAPATSYSSTNPYTVSGSRANGLWLYRNGALIGVDDIVNNRFIAYANGRAVYQRTVLPPNIDLETPISFTVTTGSGANQTNTDVTLNISLRQFFGYRLVVNDEGNTVEIADQTLEDKLEELGVTDIAGTAKRIRQELAQRLSDNLGVLNEDLYSINEAFYSYDNGLLNEIKSTAVDQNGEIMTDSAGDRLWAKDTYAAGLLISRNSYMFNYKFDENGNPEKVGDEFVLDKDNLIETAEYFQYDKGIQKGSITVNTKAFEVKGRREIPDSGGQTEEYTIPVAANTILASTVNDAFGRVIEEKAVLGLNDTATGLVVGTAVKHEYGQFGLETKTIRIFGTETRDIVVDDETKAIPKNIEVTERFYNANGQLSKTSTQRFSEPYRVIIKDKDGNPGLIEKKDEYGNVISTFEDSDVGYVPEPGGPFTTSTYVYNALGQIQYVDTFEAGSAPTRTFFVNNREFVKFAR